MDPGFFYAGNHFRKRAAGRAENAGPSGGGKLAYGESARKERSKDDREGEIPAGVRHCDRKGAGGHAAGKPLADPDASRDGRGRQGKSAAGAPGSFTFV